MVVPTVTSYLNKVRVSPFFFLLITRLYYLGRKSEVCLCVNHSVNKTKDAAASSLYKCNGLFTERIVLQAFSSPTIKTSHNHGENLCKCKPVHVWLRNRCDHRESSRFISVMLLGHFSRFFVPY